MEKAIKKVIEYLDKRYKINKSATNFINNTLTEAFNQYKKESIKWSIEDFTTYQKDGWEIDEEEAQEALEHMIRKHDCNNGTTWDTIDYYIEKYGKQIEEGKEAWRQYVEY